MQGWKHGRGPRRLAALLGAWAAALAVSLGSAGPAAAGGPTSVLVVSPQLGRTASLYHSDEEYTALRRLVGEEVHGRRERPGEIDEHDGGQVRVTWMIHDVTPWRTDRVYPASDSRTVWIETEVTMPIDASSPAPEGVWHRAEQPAALRSLLERLKVLQGPGIAGGPAQAAPPAGGDEPGQDARGVLEDNSRSVDRSDETPRPEPRAAQRTGRAGDAGWWWVFPGLAVGCATGLGGAVLIRRAADRRPPGPPRAAPRRELIDL